MMAVARVTGSDAGDRERKAKGNVGGVTICAETDFAASESFKGSQGIISARFPRPPDSLGSLASVDVTCPFHTEATVNLMTPMHAVSTD